MTYAISFALQSAVYDALTGDVPLGALVGANIFDAPPGGTVPTSYVLIGDETVRDSSSKTHDAARHDFVVSIVSEASGFSAAKQIAAAVCDALIDTDLVLTRGTMSGLIFRAATARRENASGQRVIDLRFRAFVADA